jgi:hypothetical protein
VSVVGYRARNHPQQVGRRGANSAVDDRATPPEIFGPLNDRFRFTVDAAASAENAKCERFWTAAENGLTKSWAGERVFCNPPYSHPNLGRWLDKAWQQSKAAELIVMLVPANRTEQEFWQKWVEPYRDGRGPLPGEFWLPLSNSSRCAIVDKADAELTSGHTWRLCDNGYVVTSLPRVNGKNRNIGLHRFLLGLEHGDGIQCDHRNRDRLDCRRDNLRLATPDLNGRNRSSYSNNTSGYKGVSFDKRTGRWEASIKLNYRKQFLGYFDTAQDAALAYDAAAREAHGAFASPNSEISAVRPRFRTEFLPGRLRFLARGQSLIGPNERPPFGCCLLIWQATP